MTQVDLRQLNGDQIDSLYQESSSLILELPAYSEFGIDGKLWTVQALSGVKFLPPGLHLFVIASPVSSATPSPVVSNRHGLFHFVSPKTCLLREWDETQERILPSCEMSSSRTSVSSSGDAVSLDHLRSLDATLAPYPYDVQETWTSLTCYIDHKCLARVVGMRDNGDALVDGLSLASSEAPKPMKQQWGKPRSESQGTPEDVGASERDVVHTLNFASFDIKRSWPSNAIGEELTMHSRDKHWLREQVSQQVQGPRQLLGEMQLAYLLLTQLTNFSALDAYRDLITLFAQSSISANDLDTYIDFLSLLHNQLTALRPEFFVEDLPELESFFISTLETLRQNLKPVVEHIAQPWTALQDLVPDKFGWSLKPVSGFMPVQPGTTHYNLASQEGQSGRVMDDEDLLAEEGDDAPVVVEL